MEPPRRRRREQESRTLLEIRASSNSFRRRKFRSCDCPLGKQSHANPTRPTQSFQVTTLSHRIAIDSPLPDREIGLFSTSNRTAGSLRRISELVDSVQLTQTSALTSLRPVPKVRIPFPPPRSLDCRENPLSLRRNTRILPAFRDYSHTNRTAENGLLGSEGGHYSGFLWSAPTQSGFQ